MFAKFQSELDKVAHKNVEALVVPTLLALFIFGFIYEVFLVWDALRLKNTIQVIGLCICNLGLLVYAAVQIEAIRDNTMSLKYKTRPEDGGAMLIDDFWKDIRPFLTAIPCVLAVGTIAMSFVAWKLYHEFAWTIYKHISADLRMKRRYLAFQVRMITCGVESQHTRADERLVTYRSTLPCSSLTSCSSWASPCSS